MNQQTTECSIDKNDAARRCLRLISEIADRGARSSDPEQIGYALQELTQVLFERTGNDDRVFEPVAPSQIDGLSELHTELEWVNGFAQDLTTASRPN